MKATKQEMYLKKITWGNIKSNYHTEKHIALPAIKYK